MNYCSRCGNKIEEGASFCPNCGIDLNNFNYNASTPAPKKMNGLCIVGFICSFVFVILGLILSIIGYNEAKKSGEDGKEFAMAGIIISAAKLILFLVILILIFSVWSALPAMPYMGY